MNAIYSWTLNGSGLPSHKVVWAQQDAPRPEEPAIVMRLSIFDDVGSPWADHEVNLHSFSDITITGVDTGADTLTAVTHGRLTSDGPVKIETTGTAPGGLTTTNEYWIIKVDDNTFKLAASFLDSRNNIAIDITSAGTGTHKLVDTPNTLRAGEEIKHFSRAMLRVWLTLECYTSIGVGMDMATSILNRIRSRAALPSQKEILEDANIGLYGFDRVFALLGVRDAFLFEPRASVVVQLTLPSEEAETGTIIERTEITNEIPDPDHVFTVDAAIVP